MSAPYIPPFRYTGPTPPGYLCQRCKTSGVRLYRDYQTFLEHQRLLCTACAEKASSRARKVDPENPHQCGWMVAAVPTEDGATFWGFHSVPQAGVLWWDNLPVTPP
jgi:hypothetical protein